eukprot:TRINITY_DN13976_c0_g2_i1.p1 TRINITY_DN13976_c0_g2~~TRINITY_DN13976_c0_g2_i1.p1  ORF type:complete len:246 (+),score=38.38 TRINITY_DN13976_c0_g2_i1:84-821(+)
MDKDFSVYEPLMAREPVFLLAVGGHDRECRSGSLVTSTQWPRTLSTFSTSPAFVTVAPSADDCNEEAVAYPAVPDKVRAGDVDDALPFRAGEEPYRAVATKSVAPAAALVEAARSATAAGVTLMIRHLPCRCEQADLVRAIDDAGFKGTYASVNIPMRRRFKKGGQSNLGYAFIHFPEPSIAVKFWIKFDGFRFEGSLSEKVCSVGLADVQQGAGNSKAKRAQRGLEAREKVFGGASASGEAYDS